jgi:hypothetical protein
LLDPCTPPNEITAAVLDNQEYTITGTATEYTHPEFIIEPDFCQIAYSYEIGASEKTNEAIITRTDRTFSFFYATDLAPLAETLSVKITATSGSMYSETSPETSLSTAEEFFLNFKNPCIDSN